MPICCWYVRTTTSKHIHDTLERKCAPHNLLVVRPLVLFFIVRLFYDQLWPKGNGLKGERRQLFSSCLSMLLIDFDCPAVVDCKVFYCFACFWFHSIIISIWRAPTSLGFLVWHGQDRQTCRQMDRRTGTLFVLFLIRFYLELNWDPILGHEKERTMCFWSTVLWHSLTEA